MLYDIGTNRVSLYIMRHTKCSNDLRLEINQIHVLNTDDLDNQSLDNLRQAIIKTNKL